MKRRRSPLRSLAFHVRAAAGVATIAAIPGAAEAQVDQLRIESKDTALVVASSIYDAGGFYRLLLGSNYRDEWATKIRLPVLELSTFAGGVEPTKVGGGLQTRSLRLENADGVEYVFRPVQKTSHVVSDRFRHTIVSWGFRHIGSASHPGAAVAAAPMMEAAGILHPTPIFVVMGDDPLLGEFRKEFAGQAGTIEQYPSVPKGTRGFAGALEIVDAEDFLERIDKSPAAQPDQQTMLKARLVDLLLGDNDRHPDQWKWARMSGDSRVPYKPIARDRDKVFVSYGGFLLRLARLGFPSLVRFRDNFTDPAALFNNTRNFDRRMLGALDRAVWDSTARDLQRRITDSVIDATIDAMPREYRARDEGLDSILRARRDGLHEAAMRYYGDLFQLGTVQGTDAADNAQVVRRADGSVDVSVRLGNDAPWYSRRFDPSDTREIRVYLHGGNDSAVVTGNAQESIPVRIIGGNGDNHLVDESTVNGRQNPTGLYDQGLVEDVKYGRDLAAERKSSTNALSDYHNRRPWVRAYGTLVPPQTDFGAGFSPVLGIRTEHGLGVVPKIGVKHESYGFRKVPYSTMMEANLEVSSATHGVRVETLLDKRFESSEFHLPVNAFMSQIEVTQFHGFGNRVDDSDDEFFEVNQTQWQIRSGAGFSFAPGSDISIGPIFQYTRTDSSETLLSSERPYGFRTFSQAGLQASIHFDTKPVAADTMKPRVVVDVAGAAFPGILDATTAYQSVEGSATTFFTLGFPNRPVLALRAGGKKLFGDFPYFDAAYLGGESSFRLDHHQRYAGDASLYGSSELRVPVVKFPFILPLDVGLLGFADLGRVYVDGESPGGWHDAQGAGFWVAAVNPSVNVNVLFTNRTDKRTIVNLGFTY